MANGGSFNFEDHINGLPPQVTITVFDDIDDEFGIDLDPTVISPYDRNVIIAENTIVAAEAVFDNLNGNLELANLDLSLMGGSVITGDVSLPTTLDAEGRIHDAMFFQTLDIFSLGDTPNVINGWINANPNGTEGENNLLTVNIDAEEGLAITGGIEFSAVAFTEMFELTLHDTLLIGCALSTGHQNAA